MKIKLTMVTQGLAVAEQNDVMEMLDGFLARLRREGLVDEWKYELKLTKEEV